MRIFFFLSLGNFTTTSTTHKKQAETLECLCKGANGQLVQD